MLFFIIVLEFIQGVSNRMPFGAIVCNDRVHGKTNAKDEDMESREREGMSAG